MRFGLSENDEKHILQALTQFPEIEQAVIFGSRALGNYKPGSDVDLAIAGAAVTRKTVLRLRALLNEDLPLPYFFDVAHYEKIQNDALKQHIDHEGRLLFRR